jgi:hypothetical protein
LAARKIRGRAAGDLRRETERGRQAGGRESGDAEGQPHLASMRRLVKTIAPSKARANPNPTTIVETEVDNVRPNPSASPPRRAPDRHGRACR